MMKIFLIFTLLVSFSAFSQNYDGGQTGNGGNGCWFQDSQGNISWKTIEELRYWNIIAPELSRYHTRIGRIPNDPVRIRGRGFFYQVDMTDFVAVKRALKRLSKIESQFPKVYKVFSDYFTLLKSVTVTQFDIKGIYEGDVSHLQFPCLRYAPAILTVSENEIYLVRPVWNVINIFSAEIVIVHEIIRFAQLFQQEFYDLENDELQELTAVLFSRKNFLHHKARSILSRFESRLQ